MNTNKNIGQKGMFFFALLLILSTMSLSSMVFAANDDSVYLETVLLNQDPDPATQGEYVDLRWKITKHGSGEIQDISFKLDVDYPFYFDEIDQPVKEIGNWIGYTDDEEYYILHYKVRVDDDALEDTYDVRLTTTQGKTQAEVTEKYQIKVGEQKDPEFVLGTLITSPTKLLADTDENQLDVTLENIGDEDAQTVRMELSLPKGFSATYGYSTRANVGTIAQGDNEVGTFYINLDENITEGEYEASVSVYYKEANDDDNEYKVVVLPLMIPVNGKPMFEIVSVESTPEELYAGQDVELLLTIKNTGTKEAESVSIRAFKESSQPFEFDEKSDYIGKLEPGQTGEAILKLSVDQSANSKTHLMDIEIRGLYNDEVITENEIISLRVLENERSGISMIWIIIGLVIIAGIPTMIYWKKNMKRRKK